MRACVRDVQPDSDQADDHRWPVCGPARPPSGGGSLSWATGSRAASRKYDVRCMHFPVCCRRPRGLALQPPSLSGPSRGRPAAPVRRRPLPSQSVSQSGSDSKTSSRGNSGVHQNYMSYSEHLCFHFQGNMHELEAILLLFP